MNATFHRINTGFQTSIIIEMGLLIVIGILLVSTVLAVPQGLVINEELNDEWETFKINFNRKYDPLTEISKRLIWEDNLKYIQQHNIEYDLGKHSYHLGINEFSDMTHEEFKSKYLGLRLVNDNFTDAIFMPPENMVSYPQTVDWRDKGYVTPVKNQLQCGSCWSFSTTGSLEGQHFRKTRKLISLSEQQLVDCSRNFGNNGCSGGLMNNAFRYIQRFGIELESSYPYTARDGQCRYNSRLVVAHCRGFHNVKRGNELDLLKAVATVGPISVAIDASHRSFQSYKGGVYNNPGCSSTQLDHGVLNVGYGIDSGSRYWLVKNSWGPSWGAAGYIKMSKDRGNQCGIATMASYPIV